MEAPPGEWERLGSLLDRNFNTPAALAVVHEWLNNGYLDLAERFFSLFGMGGLAERREAPQHVLNLAVERARARAEGRYGDADALRQSLDREGWVVRDSGDNGFDLVHK